MERKIIDAFMFFNEIDVLELRLSELYDAVDYFVIVESNERHGGEAKKPAYIADNWQRFEKFAKKIRYTLLPNLLPTFTPSAKCTWARENYHRNMIMPEVLKVAAADDLVILSDCDEVPRASAVTANLDLKVMKRLNLDFFYYNVNRYLGNWCRSTIGPLAAYVEHGGLQAVRNTTGRYSWDAIDNAGWHFSFFGDVARLREKSESFAEHGEDWGKRLVNHSDDQIVRDVLSGRDIFHRTQEGMDRTFEYRETTDQRLPSHFLSNLEQYEKFTEAYFRKKYAGAK